jgi:hypothetical protein
MASGNRKKGKYSDVLNSDKADYYVGKAVEDDPATAIRKQAREVFLAREELGLNKLGVVIAFAMQTGKVNYDEVDESLGLKSGTAEAEITAGAVKLISVQSQLPGGGMGMM